MNIFIIGASGYIGSAVANRLQAEAHSITGLARSEQAVEKLSAAGITPVRGAIQDRSIIRQQVAAADAVIYTAVEFTDTGFDEEYQTILAIIDALKGSNKPLLFTSGVGVLGNSLAKLNEESPYNTWPFLAKRVETEHALLAASKQQGIRSVIIRPGMLYGGAGGRGLGFYIKGATELGFAPYLGDIENCWPTVHIDDLADLYLLAVTSDLSPTILHAVSPTTVRFVDVATEVAKSFQLAQGVKAWSEKQLVDYYGDEGTILCVNQHFETSQATLVLGWQPSQRGLLDEIRTNR